MIEDIEHFIWDHSYLLAWDYAGDSLKLWLELMLSDQHPRFEEYDRKQFAGCYKLGLLTFHGIKDLKGLPQPRAPLQWKPELEEYHDRAEFEEVNMENGWATFSAEGFDLVFAFGDLALTLLVGERFED